MDKFERLDWCKDKLSAITIEHQLFDSTEIERLESFLREEKEQKSEKACVYYAILAAYEETKDFFCKEFALENLLEYSSIAEYHKYIDDEYDVSLSSIYLYDTPEYYYFYYAPVFCLCKLTEQDENKGKKIFENAYDQFHEMLLVSSIEQRWYDEEAFVTAEKCLRLLAKVAGSEKAALLYTVFTAMNKGEDFSPKLAFELYDGFGLHLDYMKYIKEHCEDYYSSDSIIELYSAPLEWRNKI